MRKAIRHFLSDHSEIVLVGEAEDLNEAFMKAKQLRPDVLLFDLHLAERCESQFNSIFADAKPLAITFGIDEESRALADRVGVKKLVDKINLTNELAPAILRLAQGTHGAIPSMPFRRAARIQKPCAFAHNNTLTRT